MPIIPNVPFVLDTVYSALAAAKVRLNDELPSLQPIGGKLLGAGSPFTQQVVNNSWRAMLGYLASVGFTALKQEAVIYTLPVAGSSDPAASCRIDWFNCYDGANIFDAPVLPPDLIVPLKLWERPTGQNTPFPQDPMELFFDGLPGLPKQTWNGAWEWRANAIYFPGALQSMDFRLLYSRYLGDFLDAGDIQWFQQSVPIPQCQDAFALYICAEIRRGMESEGWLAKAESAARLLCNRDASMKQRGNVRRQSRSGRLEGSGYYAW